MKLVHKDSIKTFLPRENEAEDLRTRSVKRFRILDSPGQYRIGAQVGPIHFQKNPFNTDDPWEEIDLDVLLTPDKPWDAACETNGYQVRFWQNLNRNSETFHFLMCNFK
jgi:hypothetical protein